MAIKWEWLKTLLIRVLRGIFGVISPEIKDFLTEALQNLYRKAEETENPWDDMFVGFLLDILGIPKPSA